MAVSFREVGPGRLQIREGGGAIGVFGLPFFAAGVFVILGTLGIVPLSNPGGASGFARPLLGLMGLVFTGVGGMLVLGRKWTTLDTVGRCIVRQWGLLAPLHENVVALDDYSTVSISFVRGDSDTSDKFPIALKGRTGGNVTLFNPTTYADARTGAVAIAQHLHLDLEDATTDHPTRQPCDQLDRSFQNRAQRRGAPEPSVSPPPDARSTVTRDADELQILIPAPRPNAIVVVAALAPLAIPAIFGPTLASFFARTRAPDDVSRIFLAVFVLGFAGVPALTSLNALVRARRGRTIVSVSREGIRVRQRGAWRTKTVASIDAADIIDVDYSTRESATAAARRAAEQQALAAHGKAVAAGDVSPRTERVLLALARFANSGGITIKTTWGLTTFGEGLEDEEVRYLHSMIRRALH
jgi:hypothetical protein